MQPFWEHYPKKYWAEADWATWAKAGRPKVPSRLDIQPPPEREIGKTFPVVPPSPKLAAGFSLSTKPRAGNARSRGIDALLEQHGIHK